MINLRYAITSMGFIFPHTMPLALVVALMYGLREQQLLHATTTALLGCTGLLAVLAPDMNNPQAYLYSLLECMASAFLVGFTVYSWFERTISTYVVLTGYVVLCLLGRTPRNTIFDATVQELRYVYQFIIVWTCGEMTFRSYPVVEDVKVALIIAIGISLRPKAHPWRLLVLAVWNVHQTYTAILLWQGIQSSHVSYTRLVGRSAGHPNPWGPAIVGAILGGLIGGTTAVLLWYFSRRASGQQHRELIEALGVHTDRAGPVMESHRQDREAATALAVGEPSEARRKGVIWIEMDNAPPISVDDETEEPMPPRRPMPLAYPTRL